MDFHLRFTDPGMHPKEIDTESKDWSVVEDHLKANTPNYTRVTITFPDATRLDLWRPVGHSMWLPFSCRQWFTENYPDAL